MQNEKQIAIEDTATLNTNGQDLFVGDWDHEYVALEGGWGSGKTWAGVEKLLTLHCFNAVNEVERDGVVQFVPTFVPSAMIGLDFRSLWDTVIPNLENALERFGIEYEIKKSDKEIIIRNFSSGRRNSIIYLRTAEEPDRITGWEVGSFLCDEAARYKEDRLNPKNDPLTQVRGRLRHPKAKFRQGLFTYTNEGAHTRVYQEFHSNKKNHALYRASTRGNPHLPVEFVESVESALTPELVEQYIDGGAIDLSGGSVYSQFDRSIHVSDDAVLNDRYPLALMMDFNREPGMHAYIGQYWAAEDRVVIVYEIHARRLDVRGCIRTAARIILDNGGAVRYGGRLQVFADATGKAQHASGPSDHEMMFKFIGEYLPGVEIVDRIPKSNPMVSERVNTVNLAMKEVSGKPHYVHHPRCERLTCDFVGLTWADNGKINERDKLLTHASSAVGYFITKVRPMVTIKFGGSARFGVRG